MNESKRGGISQSATKHNLATIADIERMPMARKNATDMIRYTRRLKTKNGDAVNIRIFTNSRIKFVFAFIRGWYEFSRGNSYEYNDVWL